MSLQISAVIITYNEERNIERCLNSLGDLTDEIVVVDSLSTDRTRAICERFGVRFIAEPFRGYKEQKNFAMECASHDMILSLDADEALTQELTEEIRRIKKNGAAADAYAINRLNNFCGHFVRHGAWYPDRKIRLWNRHSGRWEGGDLHEVVMMQKGTVTRTLAGNLLHYTSNSLSEYLIQMNKYSDIAARESFRRNKKANVLVHLVLYPLYTFLNSYLLKLGFLDGYTGFQLAINGSYYRFLKYAKLRMLWNAQAHR